MVESEKTHPRLRVLLGSAIAMGPGKADLVDAIQRTGSISGAAREMGMSYRRAWLLVEAMNRSFIDPLIEASTGGRGGGGARVTDHGHDVLKRYREMETKAAASVEAEMTAFAALLAPGYKSEFPTE
jgi:molybdate transport system regulatory protein